MASTGFPGLGLGLRHVQHADGCRDRAYRLLGIAMPAAFPPEAEPGTLGRLQLRPLLRTAGRGEGLTIRLDRLLPLAGAAVEALDDIGGCLAVIAGLGIVIQAGAAQGGVIARAARCSAILRGMPMRHLPAGVRGAGTPRSGGRRAEAAA